MLSRFRDAAGLDVASAANRARTKPPTNAATNSVVSALKPMLAAWVPVWASVRAVHMLKRQPDAKRTDPKVRNGKLCASSVGLVCFKGLAFRGTGPLAFKGLGLCGPAALAASAGENERVDGSVGGEGFTWGQDGVHGRTDGDVGVGEGSLLIEPKLHGSNARCACEGTEPTVGGWVKPNGFPVRAPEIGGFRFRGGGEGECGVGKEIE